MSDLTLFHIANEYRQITEVLQNTDIDEQTLADTLEGERWTLEVKAQNYGFVIRNLQSLAASIKEAEGEMAKRRKSAENRALALQERLKLGMEIAGVTKLECPYFAIAIKSNPPAVEIFDEKQIPVSFLRQVELPPPSPDKTAIKAAIKSGIEVPGAKMITNTRIEIK